MTTENTEATEAPIEVEQEAVETIETVETAEALSDEPTAETLALLNRDTPTEEVTEEVQEAAPVVEETEETIKEDTRFSKAFTKLSKKEKELALREDKLKVVSANAERLEAAAANYSSQPVDFIKAQLTALTGSDDPGVVEGAFQELYEAMTMHVLGVDAPADLKEQSQYNKLQRDFENYKNEQQTEKTRLEEAAMEAERETKVTQAQSRIASELSEAKEEFPYLLAQKDEDPGELVFEIVWQDYNAQLQAGTPGAVPMTIQQAALKANTHFQAEAQKWAALIPSAPTTETQPTGQPATNRPGNSKTLNNNRASVAPTRDASTYIEDDEESKLRAAELLF